MEPDETEVKPAEFETCSDRIVLEEEDPDAGHPTESGDMEGEASHERFGGAEKSKISAERAGTSTSAEEECQSDWSLDQCQELLGEATENLTTEPAVDICTRGTTSFDDPLKKDPVENAGQESLSRALPEATKNVAEDALANDGHCQ